MDLCKTGEFWNTLTGLGSLLNCGTKNSDLELQAAGQLDEPQGLLAVELMLDI